MVEDIEELSSKLDRHSFADESVLAQGHVPVVETGAMEEAPVRIADDTDRFRTERGDVKQLISGCARIQIMDTLSVIVGYIRAIAAAQRVVIALGERDREAGGKRVIPERLHPPSAFALKPWPFLKNGNS